MTLVLYQPVVPRSGVQGTMDQRSRQISQQRENSTRGHGEIWREANLSYLLYVMAQ